MKVFLYVWQVADKDMVESHLQPSMKTSGYVGFGVAKGLKNCLSGACLSKESIRYLSSNLFDKPGIN